MFLSPLIQSSSENIACGSGDRPWLLEAPSGQRINVSLVDLSGSSSSTSSSTQRARTVETMTSSRSGCTRQFGFIEDKSANRNINICTDTQPTLYVSHSNTVAIVIESATEEENEINNFLIGFTGIIFINTTIVFLQINSAFLLHETFFNLLIIIIIINKITANVATAVVTAEQWSFTCLARVSAVGCSDLVPPSDAWLKRSDNVATVGCYMTRQTWILTCDHTGRWTGTFGNCTQRTSYCCTVWHYCTAAWLIVVTVVFTIFFEFIALIDYVKLGKSVGCNKMQFLMYWFC